MKLAALALLLAGTIAAPLAAQDEAAREGPVAAPGRAGPTLVVAISVDQFSADLFAEYRNRFTGGFARLLEGGVFPSGYQSHANTETCPGHSTILTGMRPAHSGMVGNNWYDFGSPLADKMIYCLEDEGVPGSDHTHYTVTDRTLLVPTLGDRLKDVSPASRVVSVAGKDRAAVMMGGHRPDEIWWWNGKAYVSYPGRAAPTAVERTNREVAARIAQAQPPSDLPAFCQPRAQAVTIGDGLVIGTGRFARAADDTASFRVSPEFDDATLMLAAGLVENMKLGQGNVPDVIDIGLSATDYIGHAYGTQGSEMCINLAALDRSLEALFAQLDRSGVDYVVVLTADHGGLDAPERAREEAAPTAQRLSADFDVGAMSDAIEKKLGLAMPALGYVDNNIYLNPKMTSAQRAAALADLQVMLEAQPQIAAAWTADEIAASPDPSGPPETWPLIMRAKANFYRPRSGDVVVALKPRVVPIEEAARGAVATHGSFWDYDRRVPILFWHRGMDPFEQPLSVETVDIMPTLAALIHLPLASPQVDGRCLDLDPGPTSTCK